MTSVNADTVNTGIPNNAAAILGQVAGQQQAYMENVIEVQRRREEAILGMLATDPHSTLQGLGIDPPSRTTSMLSKAALLGGAGAALGLGLSILPGIGPIVGAIAGGLGAVAGAVWGWADHETQQRRYDAKVRFVQHQAAAMLEHLKDGDGVHPSGDTIDQIVADSLGGVGVPETPVANAAESAAGLLALADKLSDSDGIATAAEVATLLAQHDANHDGRISSLELLTLQAKFVSDALDSGDVTPEEVDSSTTTTEPATATLPADDEESDVSSADAVPTEESADDESADPDSSPESLDGV